MCVLCSLVVRNCIICYEPLPDANFAKGNLTKEEFISLCKEVLEHNGYEVGGQIQTA